MIWKFNLADAKDLTDIAELTQARSRQLGLILNRGGNASFNYPMSAEFSDLIQEWKSAIKAYRWNWRATQLLRAGGGHGNVWDCVWTGYVANVDEDISGDRMQVNAVGWLERFAKRFLRRDRDYPYVAGTSWDDADIIFDLLAEANATATEHAVGVSQAAAADGYTLHWPAGSIPNTPTWVKKGAKLPNEGVGGLTAYTPMFRGKNYLKYQNIGQAFTELTEIEAGCDIHVDPVTRELNIYRRMRKVRDNVIFGYNWGPSNVQQLGRTIDGTTQINYHVSQGAAGTVPKYQDDVAAMQEYGPLEEMATLSDVQDIVVTPQGASQSVLWSYSAAEIALRAQARQIFTLTPFPYNPNYGGVPEPFVDYGLGDQVRFTAKWPPRINIENQAVRVFGLGVTIDDNGNEKLGQLQFAP